MPCISEADGVISYRNYTSAAIGVIMTLALITWLTTGRRQFAGPPGSVIEGSPQVEIEGVQVEEKMRKEKE